MRSFKQRTVVLYCTRTSHVSTDASLSDIDVNF
jgi:hypothetical protein